jgi:hypothetical protein
MSGAWQEKEFQLVRKAIGEKYAGSLLDEQDLMLKQLELLEECKEKIERRRNYESFNNLSLYAPTHAATSPTSPPSRTCPPPTKAASAIDSLRSSRTPSSMRPSNRCEPTALRRPSTPSWATS